MTQGKIPDKNTAQWKKNETTINNHPVLKQARDTSEGIEKPKHRYGSTHGGKGSAQRPTNIEKFKQNWDLIDWSKK